MGESLTPGQENYLEHIHRLSDDGKVAVRVRDIAEAAGVRMPSVTRALGKLVDRGLVTHQRYGGVEISELGIQAARDVRRRDRCLQALLVDVLAMPDAEAAGEVCRLEHVLSAEVLVRLEVLIKHATGEGAKPWLQSLHRKIGRKKSTSGSSDAGVGDSSLHG